MSMTTAAIRHRHGPGKATWVTAGVALTAPMVALALLLRFPGWERSYGDGTSHFYIVSLAAAFALVLAIAVGWAARHTPDARTCFLAMGFLSIATIFLAHGLGTSPWLKAHHGAHGSAAANDAPASAGGGDSGSHAGHGTGGAASGTTQDSPPPAGPLTEKSIQRLTVVGYSARLSLFAGAIFFALAAFDLRPRAAEFVMRRWPWLMAAGTVLLAGHVVVALAFPGSIARIPLTSNPLSYIVAGTATACFTFAGWRYLQAYRLAYLPIQGMMAVGMVLLIESQAAMLWGRQWQTSWWMYHVLMLVGFVAPTVALLRQYRLTGDLGAIVEGLFLRKHVQGLRLGDPGAMHALGAAVAAKDSETAEHIERVGELSVAIGHRLGLPKDRLHVLRIAGRLHDIGKIGVPNRILRKPGGLTNAEFEIVKLHSPRGWRIARRSKLLADAADIIRAHHEKLDGTGYPDGLRGEQIPLEARIVAVADVWDALTCDRPYRKAMSRAEAAEILRRDAGSHLDPVCVNALFDLLGLHELVADGDARQQSRAA